MAARKASGLSVLALQESEECGWTVKMTLCFSQLATRGPAPAGRQIQTRKIRKNGGCYTLCGLFGLNLCSTLIRKYVMRTVLKRSITVQCVIQTDEGETRVF